MKKRLFVAPQVEIICLPQEDVITQSVPETGVDTKEWWEVTNDFQD